MKVSISWLKELVDLKVPIEEVIRLLPLRTVGLKEVTPTYFELDMKGYNRADLLSMRGVAYEIAAITGSEVKFKEQKPMFPQIPEIDTAITDEKLCPVYCVAKIENLKNGNSNETWVKKLNGSGIRSVNSIADVTNLIMLEYGQPLHAFDAEQVRGSVRVRVAKEGEKIITLDGKTRNLNETDLLITDDNGPIGIAGVMGGKNSEVSDSTTTILLEAAIFDPVNLRSTATKLGLPSEAGKRFQHGLTRQRCLQALDTAIKMYQSLGGNLTGITLTGNLKDETKTIQLAQGKVNSLIGIDIKPEQVESSLNKLGFTLASHLTSGNVNWETTPPYWRLDINIAEDIIEEIARMYGYERIKPKELSGKLPEKIDQSFFELIYKLKTTLVNLGLTEIQTYSFYSTAIISNFKFQISNLIKLLNPMSAETEYLRDMLWPNLLEATAKNIRNGIKDVAIFEIGKVYWWEEGEPKETYHLAIALSNGTDNPIQELHQISQEALKHLRGEEMRLHLGGEKQREYFHPTRYKNGLAEVHPRIVNKFGVDQRIAVLETNLEPYQ